MKININEKEIELKEGEYELKIETDYLEIFNQDHYIIYYQDSDGYEEKWTRDTNNNIICYKDSNGFYIQYIRDANNNIIYYEDSYKNYYKKEYDNNNELIYHETSGKGVILDKRNKIVITLDEIAKKFGVSVDNLKIKK